MTDTLGGNAAERLKSFVERLSRLDEENETLKTDIKSVYAELKGEGFTPKTVRQIMRLLKQDKAKRQEDQAILDLYAHALGLDLF